MSTDNHNQSIVQYGSGSINIDNIRSNRDVNTTNNYWRPQEGPPVPTTSQKIKITFFGANPDTTAQLRNDRELRAIQEAIQLSGYRERFQISALLAARANDVLRSLTSDVPQFLHFSGHARSDGIILENENGTARSIPMDAFARTLQRLSPPLACVFLNACHTALQGSLLAARIPFVITMPNAVHDRVAIVFATGFYYGIGAGRSVPEAFATGWDTVCWHNMARDFRPQLLP